LIYVDTVMGTILLGGELMAGRRKKKWEPPPTIWEVSDALWKRIDPAIQKAYPPKPRGRHRIDLRQALNGIIFRLRSGCQWNQLPKRFGDDSSVHRWFQRWSEDGFFKQLWSLLLLECDELSGVDWEWQAADGMLGKARFGGRKLARIPQIGQNPARRKASMSMVRVARLA
jgi:putative transposase